MDVMFDLETMSVQSNAAILSIGAVNVDLHAGKLGDDPFYVNVDLASCMKIGLHVQASTIEWWIGQSPGARARLFGNALPLPYALTRFSEWYGHPSRKTWGNGCNFDNVILRNAYQACDMVCPFDFWDDRCYRTLKNLFPNVVLPRAEVEHDALSDAVAQAEGLIELYNQLHPKAEKEQNVDRT